MIKVIERIEKRTFDLSNFTEEEVDFIKCLVKLGFSEGFEKGEKEIKAKILKTLDNDT